jgi:hypothetical protein
LVRPTRVLLVGLSPMAEDILVRHIAEETGLEMAGRIGPDASLPGCLAVARPDVAVVGADIQLSAGERARLLANHPDLLLLQVAPDERSTCACSTASPQEVLRSVLGALRAHSR